MDKTFSLTDVEQQWFPIEVIERYFRLARKLDIPQQLHRLSARGWVMLKALRRRKTFLRFPARET